MNFIKVKNPTEQEVALLFRGQTYVIGAKATESFPMDVAKQWITIYQFMDFVGHADEATPEKVETPVEEAKEVTKTKTVKKK